MVLRICLLLGVAVSLSIVSSAPFAADKADSVTKPGVTKADVAGMMKSLSNWGRWGASDELGTLNLITPEKRKQAAALIKEGVTVSLAHNVSKSPIASSTPFSH